MAKITKQLDELARSNKAVKAPVEVALDLSQISIADFLQLIADTHQINITVAPSLKNRFMVSQFNQVNIQEVLLYLCKHFHLDLDITGSIIHVFPYTPPPKQPPQPQIEYQPQEDKISLNLQNHPLETVFRMITEQTPNNLLFHPSIAQKPINFYVKHVDFSAALSQLAKLHALQMKKNFGRVFGLRTPTRRSGEYTFRMDR